LPRASAVAGLAGGFGRLALGIDPEESFDAAEEGLRYQGRVEEAAGRHRAVAEHDEVAGRGSGRFLVDARHQYGERVEEPLSVGDDFLVDGLAGVGILRGGVQEGASAESGALDAVSD
jgi:hypothetical protein